MSSPISTPTRLGLNRRILMQVSAPSVLVGLMLFGTCLVSAWYVNHLQSNLTDILAQNVSSMQAAHQLEAQVRQLRFHSFLYLIEPASNLMDPIRQDELKFRTWLEKAEEVGQTEEERRLIATIRAAFNHYKQELEDLRQEVERDGPRKNIRALAKAHPVLPVTSACAKYAELNEATIARTVQETSNLSQRLHITMLLLGLGGPLAGLIGGYGIARGLSRSLFHLSVRVQDMAQSLEQDVAAVNLMPEGDLQRLDEQLDHVVARVSEVTQRLQRQQRDMLRAQQLAAVGQLAASVAHEVRNPLTSIKLLVEASLRPHNPKPLTAENVRVIHGEVRRLEATVQGFLDFARPPALQRAKADLCDIVKRAAGLVRARADQQKVTLVIHCPDAPLPGHVDSGQLSTVFVNLLINALDAMPTGGTLEVTVEATRMGEIRCTVRDSGEGIRAEIMAQLFTPFASSKATGSGLGLSICKRVVEEHGGAIAGGNCQEGGAVFTITLPAHPEASHAALANH